MLIKKDYKLDLEELKEYFPMEQVAKETMEIYQELLGLKFTRLQEGNTWHEDVKLYQTEDKATGKILGHFYMDLYHRDKKMGHASVSQLVQRAKIGDKEYLPVVVMIATFDKPTPEKPSLLPHQDVVTFFHEFGHIMHNLCTESNNPKFSGANVEKDFVELPS